MTVQKRFMFITIYPINVMLCNQLVIKKGQFYYGADLKKLF